MKIHGLGAKVPASEIRWKPGRGLQEQGEVGIVAEEEMRQTQE